MHCFIHKLQIIYEFFFWNSIMDHKLNLRLFISDHVHLEHGKFWFCIIFKGTLNVTRKRNSIFWFHESGEFSHEFSTQLLIIYWLIIYLLKIDR